MLLTRRNKGIGDLSEYWQMGLLINDVHAKSISSLHEDVEIMATGTQLHPARVVSWVRSVQFTHQLELAGFVILLVRPDLVGAQVCGVEVGLRLVKHHTVDASLGRVRVILDVFQEATVFVCGEHVSV